MSTLKKKKKKKPVKKPKASILGTGAAARAAKAMSGRAKKIQDAENKALGIKPKGRGK